MNFRTILLMLIWMGLICTAFFYTTVAQGRDPLDHYYIMATIFWAIISFVLFVL
jgi:hypothetical protein